MTALHVHVPCEKIKNYLKLLRHHKLNLEIYFAAHVLDTITKDKALELRDMLDFSSSLTFHAPFMDLSPGAVDKKVHDITITRFRQALDLAQLLQPECIVFHSGYDRWKYALKMDIWLDKSLETWHIVNDFAKELGIKIAIENIFEDEPSNLTLLMYHMNSPNFGICFDTGHWNLFSRTPLSEWLSVLRPYIFELHLHDNDGKSDAHLPIGDGTFDFDVLFTHLKGIRCISTIESHTPERVLTSIERFSKYASLSK